MGRIIKIRCPKCGEKLEVDVERRKVISISFEKDVAPDERLSRMIEKLKEEASTRDKRFQGAQEAFQKKKEELEKAFDKLKKRAEKEIEEEGIPDSTRPIDLE